MLWLLKLCLFGHIHRWKILSEGRLEGHSGGRGTRYILQCEKCGDVAKRDLI